jgi:hypothetical protein
MGLKCSQLKKIVFKGALAERHFRTGVFVVLCQGVQLRARSTVLRLS